MNDAKQRRETRLLLRVHSFSDMCMFYPFLLLLYNYKQQLLAEPKSWIILEFWITTT